ncbi:MAG: hypothetical protein ABR915_11935 [Thermoguttaceae bacterium]|jgi:hypothetical protein
MRLARTVAVSLVLTMLMGGWTVTAHGWSLLHPFSADQPDTQPAKTAPKPAAAPSSTAGKAASNNNGFLSGIGDAFTSKKTPPKKPAPTFGHLPSNAAKPASKPSSFWSSLNPFHKEEPKKPKTVQDFMAMERPK